MWRIQYVEGDSCGVCMYPIKTHSTKDAAIAEFKESHPNAIIVGEVTVTNHIKC